MKKFLLAIGLVFAMTACNSDSSTKGGVVEAPEKAMDPQLEKGLNLVTAADCAQCHKVADQVTGPSFFAIAEKYRTTQNITDTLADRIITGSTGHWGAAIMIPHPDLSKDDARLMVKYILSLKN